MSILSFLFGSKDKRVLRKLGSVVNSINDLEQKYKQKEDGFYFIKTNKDNLVRYN